MVNEYKSIVLLDGLHHISDYHFEMIKSLLARDLKLTPKMQQEYNRIKIADLMEKNFPGAACVEKLIELIKNIPELQEHAKTLRKKKLNVAKKLRAKGKTPEKKEKPERAGPATPAPPALGTQTPSGAEATPVAQKRKNTNQEKTGTKKTKVSQEQTQHPHPAGVSESTVMDFFAPPTESLPSTSSSMPSAKKGPSQRKGDAKRSIPQKGPLTVMVLKASKPFEYECPEQEKDMMFHATVATDKQFFQVKVLNINLKEKFTKTKAITLSDYFECKGILEVNRESSVSDADPSHLIKVPKSLMKRATETPKIDSLLKQASGTLVYGLFEIHKKKVNKKNTIYEIQDNTGKMDVVGSGKWHKIECEEGDKFRLFCWQLRMIDHKLNLTCGNHSFLQVIKTKKYKKAPPSFTVSLQFEPKCSLPNQLGGLSSDTIKVETL